MRQGFGGCYFFGIRFIGGGIINHHSVLKPDNATRIRIGDLSVMGDHYHKAILCYLL